MTLFARIEVLEGISTANTAAITVAQADIDALKASPPSGVTAEQLAAVQAQVDGLRADVGTPSTPPAA